MSISFYALDNSDVEKMGRHGPIYRQIPVPYLNLSNDNAMAFLKFVGIYYCPEDGCGQVDIKEALAAIAATEIFFDESAEEHKRLPAMGENFISFGIDKAYFRERFKTFKKLVNLAAEQGATTIYWA